MPSRCRSGGKAAGLIRLNSPMMSSAAALHLLRLGGQAPSPTTLGRASRNRSRLGSVMRMRGISSRGGAGLGGRAGAGDRQATCQVDSAVIRAGQAHGSSGQVHRAGSVSPRRGPCPRTRCITPRRYFARRAGGRWRHPRRWRAPPPCTRRRTGRCPTTVAAEAPSACHRRPRWITTCVTRPASWASFSSAAGRVPVLLDGVVHGGGVFVALHVLVRRSRSAVPAGRPLVLFLGGVGQRLGPLAAPAAGPSRSSCPRAWAPPWAAAVAASAGHLGVLVQLQHRLGPGGLGAAARSGAARTSPAACRTSPSW